MSTESAHVVRHDQGHQPASAQPLCTATPITSNLGRGDRRLRRRPEWRALLALALVFVLATAGCAASTSTNTGGPLASATAAPTVVVPSAVADLEQTVQTVIERVQPSIVEVQSSGSQGQSIGSGEVVAADGYIVTNDHVVHGFVRFSVVLANGRTIPASLAGEAPGDDLALLKVQMGGLRPITLGNSNAVKVGTFVLAIGSPLGLDQSATFGIVSALNRTASEAPSGPATTLTGLIQTSAPINAGNSGGALVNLRGELIGIPTLGASDPNSGGAANGIGFAIPANRVQFVTDQLIKSGHMTSTGQGFLGVSGVDVTPDLAAAYSLPADSGVLITEFVPDATGKSPAESAGLRPGDIIVAVNQSQVTGNSDLAGVLLALPPGTRVQVSVQRGSAKQQVTVTLGERPAQ